jgi:hypothetical protein
VFPSASRTLTVAVDVDAPSLMIADGENEQVRWSAPPAVQTSVLVVLVRLVAV